MFLKYIILLRGGMRHVVYSYFDPQDPSDVHSNLFMHVQNGLHFGICFTRLVSIIHTKYRSRKTIHGGPKLIALETNTNQHRGMDNGQ